MLSAGFVLNYCIFVLRCGGMVYSGGLTQAPELRP